MLINNLKWKMGIKKTDEILEPEDWNGDAIRISGRRKIRAKDNEVNLYFASSVATVVSFVCTAIFCTALFSVGTDRKITVVFALLVGGAAARVIDGSKRENLIDAIVGEHKLTLLTNEKHGAAKTALKKEIKANKRTFRVYFGISFICSILATLAIVSLTSFEPRETSAEYMRIQTQIDAEQSIYSGLQNSMTTELATLDQRMTEPNADIEYLTSQKRETSTEYTAAMKSSLNTIDELKAEQNDIQMQPANGIITISSQIITDCINWILTPITGIAIPVSVMIMLIAVIVGGAIDSACITYLKKYAKIQISESEEIKDWLKSVNKDIKNTEPDLDPEPTDKIKSWTYDEIENELFEKSVISDIKDVANITWAANLKNKTEIPEDRFKTYKNELKKQGAFDTEIEKPNLINLPGVPVDIS